MTATVFENRLIALPEVSRRVGLGRSWIYKAIGEGIFPAFVKIGKRSLWVESEINQWIENQIAARKAS